MVDRQNRVGSKVGSGGVASQSESNRDRRERLAQLALDFVDLNKDPYFMKNHLGSYECKLCLTLHTNPGSYLAHCVAKKHQDNLKRRAYKEAQEEKALPQPAVPQVDKKKFIKIGKPGYRVTKRRDPATSQNCLFFEINYPEIVDGVEPRHRFMSAYEQKKEDQDSAFQYVLFAAEPYATISFKIENRGIDTTKDKIWTHYNADTKTFYLQFHFKADRTEENTRPLRQGFQPTSNPLRPFAPQMGAPPRMGGGMGPPMGHPSINQGMMGGIPPQMRR